MESSASSVSSSASASTLRSCEARRSTGRLEPSPRRGTATPTGRPLRTSTTPYRNWRRLIVSLLVSAPVMFCGCCATPPQSLPVELHPPNYEILRPVTTPEGVTLLPTPPPNAESLDRDQLEWLAAVSRDFVRQNGYVKALKALIGATGDATD